MSKTITVFGATGIQGGSVIRELLAHPSLSKAYHIRGVTRNVSKPAAVALTEKGVEMVTADMNDPASLVRVVKGSDIVFGVTDFWETTDLDIEVSQGKAIVDASKAANVERLIFSSLPYVGKETHGQQTGVKHFDSKGQIEEYAREIGVRGTYFMPAAYMEPFLNQFRKGDDGNYTFTTGWDPEKTKVPFIDAAGDSGLWIAAILLNLDSTLGKRIAAASEYVTANELAEAVAEVSGKKATVNKVPWSVFKGSLPARIAEEMTANLATIGDYGYYLGQPADAVQQSLTLIEKSGLRKPSTWREFVKRNLKN